MPSLLILKHLPIRYSVLRDVACLNSTCIFVLSVVTRVMFLAFLDSPLHLLSNTRLSMLLEHKITLK